jgi:MFS family permease
MYTVYSIPNVALPLFGGMFLDKIGIRVGLMLFTVTVLAGQCVFMMGGYAANYPLMLVGRVVFGMGGESMTVAQSTIVSLWFKGKELNFAMGLNLSIARLGSVVNGWVVPRVFASAGLGNALMVGAVICVASTVAAFFLVALDKKAEKLDPNGAKAQLSDDDRLQFSDLLHFKLPFWLLVLSCLVTYMSVFPYVQCVGGLLQYKYHFDEDEAAQLFGIPYIISACLCPFLGFGIDKVGRRCLFIIGSSLILIAAFTISMLLPDCPAGEKCYYEVYPLVLCGVGYSIYASVIWGSIPYTVEPKTVGTAYGICTAIQNIGLAYAPWQVSSIIDMR